MAKRKTEHQSAPVKTNTQQKGQPCTNQDRRQQVEPDNGGTQQELARMGRRRVAPSRKQQASNDQRERITERSTRRLLGTPSGNLLLHICSPPVHMYTTRLKNFKAVG